MCIYMYLFFSTASRIYEWLFFAWFSHVVVLWGHSGLSSPVQPLDQRLGATPLVPSPDLAGREVQPHSCDGGRSYVDSNCTLSQLAMNAHEALSQVASGIRDQSGSIAH